MKMTELLPLKVYLFTLIQLAKLNAGNNNDFMVMGLSYPYPSTVDLQWLKHRWLVYQGCFELVLESLGKKFHSCRFGII